MMVTSKRQSWFSIVSMVWLAYTIVLMIVTHTAVPVAMVSTVSQYDKFIHGAAYFLLAVLSVLTFLKPNSSRASLLCMWGCLLVFASLDEYFQGFVNRTPDVQDWNCDAVGAGLGCVVAFWLNRHWPRFNSNVTATQQTKPHDPGTSEPVGGSSKSSVLTS